MVPWPVTAPSSLRALGVAGSDLLSAPISRKLPRIEQ